MTKADLERERITKLDERLPGEVQVDQRPSNTSGLDLVGGVVPIHGAWWGVVLMSCERSLAVELAAHEDSFVDEVLRDLVLQLGLVAQRHLDPTAKIGPAISLDGETARWKPTSSVLQTRMRLSAGGRRMIIEILRRRRTDVVPQAADQ